MNDNFAAETQKLGAELKKRREMLGLTLEQLSGQSRIAVNYLSAIENGTIDLLPTGYYGEMFIREYCNFLGAEEIKQSYELLFETQKREAQKTVADNAHNNIEEKSMLQKTEYKRDNSKYILITAVVLLICAAIFVVVFHGGITGNPITQLQGGTEHIIEQKEEADKKAEQIADEKARKLAEKAAKAEEDERAEDAKQEQTEQAEATVQNDAADVQQKQLADGELYIYTEAVPVKIKVTQLANVIFEGEIPAGKGMNFKVTGEEPLYVRYENPNKTNVKFGSTEYKPLHPSSKGRSRYYWSDGRVTFTRRKVTEKTPE